MSRQLAVLQYMFMFEPDIDTWQRGFDFEKDLDSFFSSYGFDMDVVDTTGGSGTRVIYLTKREDKLEELSKASDKPQPEKNMGQVLAPLRMIRGRDGKFRKPNE
jgi:hypothetical protein